MSDLDHCIKSLMNNKSASSDLISNEILKNTNVNTRVVILKLLNGCLEQEIYPWNSSITTPIHKKGDRQNPDNYRAIAVGSCLGKLFSSLLLNCILQFRKDRCPDYPNQLGFCKGAQCSDHILTLKTLIDKYVTKKRTKLFTCFVDYRKAFDLVCRDALLYKISQLGIDGPFFHCIKNMYQHSSTRIKLIHKMSDTIDVSIGTEQGHPMSPELFKMFVYDLSTELELLLDIHIPNLNNYKISHLLWADDLVLIAEDAASLQKLLDILNDYITRWELEINTTKTNIMVFNSGSKLLKCSYGFNLGDEAIKPTKTYTYLGIMFSLNGSFKPAIHNLGKKAVRAYFSMKRTVNIAALSARSLLILFDSLIKPIATYASQIWLPSTQLIKAIRAEGNISQVCSKDQLEIVHLKMLKWMLGVHKKTSNIFCYGDSGRPPLALASISQGINYYRRILDLESYNDENIPLVKHAFEEQKLLNLEWYETWSCFNTWNTNDQQNYAAPGHEPTPKVIQEMLIRRYINDWDSTRLKHRKLHFYNKIKTNFGEEAYLDNNSFQIRKHIARIRSSSHDLNIERGRYKTNLANNNLLERLCRFCCITSVFL